MTVVVIILVLCILFEGLFSGSEIALVSAEKVQLRHLAEEAGKHKGRVIQDFIDDPGPLISTSLVGTNTCVVLSTVLTTLTLKQWFPGQAEVLSLAVMTPLVLIFGEIIPKSIFQTYANKLAPMAINALWFFRLLVWPLVSLGSLFSNLLLRLLKPDQQKAAMSREELGLLLKLPSRKGEDQITPEEKKIITRIFSFKSTTAEEVMVPLSELTALPKTATLNEMAQEIADKQHTRVPLYEGRLDNIVGIVHAYELLRASGEEQLEELARPPIFVPESQLAVDTLLRLQRSGQGMAVVVDEYGGATGVVTIEDILEEVVGEIEDEFDQAEFQVIFKQPDGSYRIIAKAPVERINKTLDLDLPINEDYESIAGLILDQLKRIPRTGERLEIGKVILTVTRANERAIEEIRLRKQKF